MKRGLTVVVRVHERKLAIAIGNEPESTLSHEEDVRFTFDDSDARVTFVRDAAGATIGLIVHRGSQYISARKVR